MTLSTVVTLWALLQIRDGQQTSRRLCDVTGSRTAAGANAESCTFQEGSSLPAFLVWVAVYMTNGQN